MCLRIFLTGMALAGLAGCAADHHELVAESTASQTQSDKRINCTCGTWAGGRGPKTDCQRRIAALEAQRQGTVNTH
jgi:hypothetical protein